MKTADESLKNVWTDLSARPTKELRKCTDGHRKFLELKVFDDPELIAMESNCVEWMAKFEEKSTPRWISLIGKSGTGKTHCARRMWKWIKSMPPVFNLEGQYFCPPYTSGRCAFDPRFVNWLKLVNEKLRDRQFEEFKDMANWPVLVLDDIGADRDPTGFATEQLVSLLESREMKWTVITSNLYLRQLGELDPRIASRMIRGNNQVVQMTTMDYSMRPKE